MRNHFGSFISVFFFSTLALASSGAPVSAIEGAIEASLKEALISALSERYPDARIQLTSSPEFRNDSESSFDPQSFGDGNFSLDLSAIHSNGKALFSVSSLNRKDGSAVSREKLTGGVTFKALRQVWIPKRRIHPKEVLKQDDLVLREVDIASGQYAELSGILLSAGQEVEKLESRQTLLEGQPILSSGVQKVPDIRRGDAVRLKMLTGAIELNTPGVAQEPAYKGSSVRVITIKNKRDFVGTLRRDGVVEVAL